MKTETTITMTLDELRDLVHDRMMCFVPECQLEQLSYFDATDLLYYAEKYNAFKVDPDTVIVDGVQLI